MLDTKKLRAQFEARIAELLESAKEIDAELREKPSPDFEENAVEMEDESFHICYFSTALLLV